VPPAQDIRVASAWDKAARMMNNGSTDEAEGG